MHTQFDLGGGCGVYVGEMPAEILAGLTKDFEALWATRPIESQFIRLSGKLIAIPRRQQAYGVAYRFSGQVSAAKPVPAELQPALDWARGTIDLRLNGLLLNYYNGASADYIGPHRDSNTNRIPDTPIVTISLGQERTFRIRSWPVRAGTPRHDFPARHGTVFVMPWETNRKFVHEVPKTKPSPGRRISITIRAFETR